MKYIMRKLFIYLGEWVMSS